MSGLENGTLPKAITRQRCISLGRWDQKVNVRKFMWIGVWQLIIEVRSSEPQTWLSKHLSSPKMPKILGLWPRYTIYWAFWPAISKGLKKHIITWNKV